MLGNYNDFNIILIYSSPTQVSPATFADIKFIFENSVNVRVVY